MYRVSRLSLFAYAKKGCEAFIEDLKRSEGNKAIEEDITCLNQDLIEIEYRLEREKRKEKSRDRKSQIL